MKYDSTYAKANVPKFVPIIADHFVSICLEDVQVEVLRVRRLRLKCLGLRPHNAHLAYDIFLEAKSFDDSLGS